MDAAIHPQLVWIVDWIQQYPVLANVLIFGTAFLESLLIVGTLVPGAILIISFGALISLGYLDMTSTMLLCITGAIAGDGISYWVGYHYKAQLKKIWPFRKFTSQIQAGENYFRKHGGKSVAMGRFVGPVRAIIPTIAGMMGMSPARFAFFNVLSAIAWAPAYLFPGMVFGASLELASEVAIRLVALVFAIIIILLVIRWLIRKTLRYIQPRADSINQYTLRWARQHKLLGPTVQALVDPRQPESPALLLFAFFLILAGLVFFFITSTLGMHATNLDQRIYDLMHSLRTPWMDYLMTWITMLGDTFVIAAISVLILAWLTYKRNLPAALHWGAAILFGTILIRVLKASLQIPRPDPAMFADTSFYSFPSAHSTMAMLVYGFLSIIIGREMHSDKRNHVYISGGILISLIAISRLYLGAHWFSDVIGGLSLGLIWIMLLGIAYRRHHSVPLPIKSLTVVTLISIMLSAGLHWHLHFEREINRYTKTTTMPLSALENWHSHDWQTLDTYRHDLAKSSSYPLNLQWADTLQNISATLNSHGWQPAPRIKPSNIIKWLSSKTPLMERPILPQIHKDRHESLAMTFYDQQQDGYLVIRFWPSDKLWQAKPVWLGQVAVMQTKSFLGLFHYPVTTQDFSKPGSILKQQLNSAVISPVNRTLSSGEPSTWDGEVLLIE